MKRRATFTVLVAVLVSLSATSAAERSSYTSEGDVRLGPQMERTMEEIAAEFRRRTGRRLHVTSGTRTPDQQARAMYDKIRLGQRLTRLYRDFEAASEIQTAYRRHRRQGRAATVRAMAEVIRAQIARGRYISRHLYASAVDVRSRNLSRRHRRVFRSVVRSVGGVEVLEEGRPPHFHLQLTDP